jgi:type II secretory pathway predicted ATPase ExeA
VASSAPEEQSHLVKSLVRNSHAIDDENSTRPRIVMITGTSGAGKSYVARELASERLQDMDYFLEIDRTKYAGGSLYIFEKLSVFLISV